LKAWETTWSEAVAAGDDDARRPGAAGEARHLRDGVAIFRVQAGLGAERGAHVDAASIEVVPMTRQSVGRGAAAR
jgi:hypothetical protein